MRFRFADCVLDAARFELTRAGRPVAVQPKVLALLLFLLRNHERAVMKSELLDAVWPDTATGESSLTRAVSLARMAVGEREKDARVIRTVRGRGYRIGVPVSIETPGTAAAARPDAGIVGRERELASCESALEQALAGRAQLLLLAGEPGIGKTRLAEELAGRARERGALALWGRCQDGEDGRAYWPWEQVLRAGLAAWEGEAGEGALGEGAAELAELVPELRERLPELPPPARDPERARARLFDAVRALLAQRAAAVPLVIVLDDLHCADGPSLRLLRFLAAQLREARVLLVAAHRDVAPGSCHPLANALGELSRLPPPERKLRLRGLDRASIERLIAGRLGAEPAPGLVALCHARSEGNPLFLLELLHWLEGRPAACEPSEGFEREIPDGIRHVIRARLAALSEPCRRALACASVLGRDFEAALVARASGLPEAELLALLEEAEVARALEPVRASPGRFRFAHPLIGETLYDELGSATRARLHAAVGEALEARYRPRPVAKSDLAVPIRGAHLAELAHHFHLALPLAGAAKALDYCERAAAHALTALAFAEAERLYARALGVLEASAPGDAERRAALEAARERARRGALASSG